MAPKKKLSKKEIDRKKKEEEDRKHQEEEEARIKAEQEEKERIIREKIEAEERKKIEKQELKKRSIELEDFRVLKIFHEDKLIEDEKNRRFQYSWERYLRCDGSPDPSIPQEINTYINLWREDEKNVTIEPIMAESLMCLRLIEELEFLITDYKNEESFASQISKYHETIKELQILLQEKIDRASLEMLSRATIIAENEMSNLEKVWKYQKMILCLWGNLTKNPRVTKFEFPEVGIHISIPKALILSDIAFRILYTQYDHCSGDSKHFNSRRKPVEKSVIFEVVVEKTEASETDKEKGDNDKEKDSDEILDQLNLMDELNKVGIDNDEEKEETVQEQEEEIDPPPEDLIPVPEPILWEDFEDEEYVIDLRNYTPVGGLFHINMVCLPPQPKIASGWTMTQQVVPAKLSPFPYQVSTDMILMNRQSSFDVGDRDVLSANKDKVHVARPILVNIKIPDDVILADEPQLALWETNSKEWKTEGVVLTGYKDDEKTLTFEMSQFGVVGIFQDFHINMPFQSWCLKPYRGLVFDLEMANRLKNSDDHSIDSKSAIIDEIVEKTEVEEVLEYNADSKNQSLLVINAAVFDVRLHICDSRVRILFNDEHTELNALANKWYTVNDLIKVMRTAGINIFPREDSMKYVSITEKNPVAEEMLYDQMSLLSPSVAFSWSRWNSECKNSDTCIVLASEHLNYERPVNEDDWSVLSFTRKKVEKLKMKEYDEKFSSDIDDRIQDDWSVLSFTRKKVEKLKMKEYDEKFSSDIDDRIQFHSNLHHFYEEFGTEEGMVAVKNVDSHYFNTLRNLLKAIRPLVFA